MKISLHITGLMALSVAVSLGAADPENKGRGAPLPTHADAAVLFAKYSGRFDRYISENASLNDCVTFLNKTGIYFGLMEVLNGKEFTLRDCARVMGQMSLVFNGEAVYQGGKVKLPKDVDSWENFCIMNNVDYVEAYKSIQQALLAAHKN